MGVGDNVYDDQLRAIVSANQSYTALTESKFTLLTTTLTNRLTDILCDSKRSLSCNHGFRGYIIPQLRLCGVKLK